MKDLIFQEEENKLNEMLFRLSNEKDKLKKQMNRQDEDYKELKKYMYENRNDLMETIQNYTALTNIDKIGGFHFKQLIKITKLMESPYFGRIDFKYEDEAESKTFYIGKFNFADDDNNILIYDWRAPISSMFYEYELGKASYEAPVGDIHGEITKKRQLKIKNSKLEYALESSVNIHDEALQRELSTTSDDRMKTIIATIQKEQNQIVRNESAHTLVIQGVAGSGKTSIALHRIAYLLYKYKETLSSDRVAIVSPNKVFSNYISNVLPELGEEPIRESSFDTIAKEVLPKSISFEPSFEQTARIIQEPHSNYAIRTKFKSSLDYFKRLNDYLNHLDEQILQVPKDVTISETSINREYIYKRFKSYDKLPVKKRIDKVADDVLEVIKSSKTAEIKKIPSKNNIAKRLSKYLTMRNALSVYKNFYKSIDRQELFVWHKKNTFEYPDVFPFIYCIQYFEGIDAFDGMDHLVIDEMQDYSPIQYAVINRLFTCRKTILGDFGQTLNPFSLNSDESFKNIFPGMEYVELKKSYRSSYEIIEFAKQFLPTHSIEAIKRHGEEPNLISYEDDSQQIKQIKSILSSFDKKDYSTLGIICKDEVQAGILYEELNQLFTINKLTFNSSEFKEGITLTTIQLAKGLEFDEVIIPYANNNSYSSSFDKGLLYVATTRAMHKLSVLYQIGELTPLIAKK